MGTPAAEYSERGPFHCEDCILQTPGKPDKEHGLCRQPDVKKDAKRGLIKIDKPSGLPIINLEHGCCRFIALPKGKHEAKSEAKS